MPHGERAERRNDYQWWGKRPLANYAKSYRAGVDKWWKRLLHSKERWQGKKEIEKELEAEYHLECDNCGRLFWSKEGFPQPQFCKRCKNKGG